MNRIMAGERAPSREFLIDTAKIKAISSQTGLSQEQFCRLIDVQVSTLRNWEQGRREPTGPAKALLCAIKNDPKQVITALTRNTTKHPSDCKAPPT